MNAAFIITNNFFYMGYIAIYSFLKNNKENKPNIYIVYDETLPQGKIDELSFFKKFKFIKSLNFIKIDSAKYKNFSLVHKIAYCFELQEFVNVDKILFIHSVNLTIKNLKELYNTDISDVAMAACEYTMPYKLEKEKNGSILTPLTILLNLKYLKEHKIFEKLMSQEFLEENSQYKNINDMVILNRITKNYKLIPITYGFEEIWYKKVEIQGSKETKELYQQYLTHSKTPSIVCFGNKKPNQFGCRHSYLSLWWKYAKETPIYEKIKYFEPKSFFKKIKSLFQTKERIRLQKQFANKDFYKKFSFILKFAGPYWAGALIAFGLAIPIGCLDAVIALSLKPYMDVVMIEKNAQPSWYIPFLIVAFTSAQGILNFISTYFNDWTTGKASSDIKKALYDKLMHKSTAFINKKTSGDIQKRFNNDADRVCTGIFGGIKLIISKVFSSISLIGVLIYNSWQLAILAIFILLCALFPLTKMKDCIRAVTNKSENAMSAVITDYNELFNGSKIVQAFNLYNLQNEIFNKHLKSIFDLKMQISKKTGVISPIMHIIASIGIGVTIAFGSHLVITGKITSGNFVSFITALIMLYTPIKSLGGSFKGVQSSVFALERVINNLYSKEFITDTKNAKEFKNFNDKIEFKNINFAYIKDKPVLKNINLSVKKGETLALIGNSGCGKSTLVSLLPRFYKLKNNSSIEIDGVDISNYKLNSLRDNISIVLQDNFLFAGTIKDNIIRGNLKASEEELTQAVKNAYLEEFINSLEEGLNTYIGEKGALLSGGQKQRIAIARALIKNAPIVILDEATSALDNQSEAIVQKAMDNLMKNRTVFIIAHRLSTIKNADKIAVMKDGEIVEYGIHNELIQIKDGYYKTLYEMQFNKKESMV